MEDKLNKIHLGDSLELMKLLPDNCVDLIVTDPPYIVAKGKINKGVDDSRMIKSVGKLNYGLEGINNSFDMENYFMEWERVCKKFNAFLFCSNDQLFELLSFAKEYNLISTVLIWHKRNAVPFAGNVWRPDLEYIVHIKEEGALCYGDSKEKSKIYISPTEVSKYGHPTEKPMDLIKRYIKIGSNENDIILDPFMGSGTTANACIHLDRQFIGYEIEPKYHVIACERVERAKGNFGLFEGLENETN